MRRLTTALLCLNAVLPVAAWAADTPSEIIPDVVVTATRIPTSTSLIPAGVTVIDRQTIEERNYTTLAEALSEVPGLRISQSGGFGGNASVFVRGFNSNQVLVLRDGMPINDGSDPGGAFNFGVDRLSDIERIEIVRGAMASVYGSGAMGGVINLISRRGTEGGPHVEADVAGGAPSQVLGSAVLSGVQDRFDYAATGTSSSREGFDYTPQREAIYSGVPQGFRDATGTLNLGYTPIEGTRLALFLRAGSATFGFNALGFPTFDNANSTGRSEEFLARVGGTTKLFDGALESGLFLGRLQNDRHYTERLNPLDPNLTGSDSRYHAYRTDLQWNNTLHLDPFIGIEALSATDLTFGYEYRGDEAKVRTAADFGGFAYAQSTHAFSYTNAGYLGLRTTLLQRLTVTAQGRQDHVYNDSASTWRAGGVFAIPEIATRLKAAYGTAFLAPSLYDRYGVDSSGYVGNPNLRPERAEGWEAGFESDLSARGRDNFMTFGATYFDNRVRDLIESRFSPIYTQINAGSARLQGVETQITLRPFETLSVTGIYTFTDARNTDSGQRLLRRPQSTGSVSAVFRPIPTLRIVPELLVTGAFKDFLIDNAGDGAGVGTSSQGLVVNLTVTYNLLPGVDIYAAGRNLSNSRFEPVNGYQTPGPSFLVGSRVRF